MSEESKDENQEEFNPEILLNAEMLDEYINMFASRIAHAEGEQIKKEKEMKEWEQMVLMLKNKQEVLLKYKKFLTLGGFGYTKQTADDFFDNMDQANLNRIKFGEPPEPNFDNQQQCPGTYIFMQMEYRCSKEPGHVGPCGAC